MQTRKRPRLRKNTLNGIAKPTHSDRKSSPYGIVNIPPKLKPVFEGKARYRCAFGGRGAGKSRAFALMLALRGIYKPLRILCARELQNSIKDSVHSEIVKAIESYPWLADEYEWGESYIRGKNGTEFIFKGLRLNAKEIKSTAAIDICWVEEAETVSKSSWDILVPTIRNPGSEIWVTWNPESDDSEVRKRFVLNEPSSIKMVKINWDDNPWFPPELEQERQDCQRIDPDNYDWIWEGEVRTISDAQILNGKWVVQEFEPQDTWKGPYFGADWGFASDPTAAVKMWIADNKLWIEYESCKQKLELDDTAKKWMNDIPGIEKYVVRADCARPESISYVRRTGIPRLTACKKWPGSVEDGIKFLRSFDQIVVHPRCKNFIYECKHYSYKVDAATGDILPKIVDKHNHGVDSCRYGLGPLIQNKLNRSGYGRSHW